MTISPLDFLVLKNIPREKSHGIADYEIPPGHLTLSPYVLNINLYPPFNFVMPGLSWETLPCDNTSPMDHMESSPLMRLFSGGAFSVYQKPFSNSIFHFSEKKEGPLLGLKKQGILGTSRCSWCGLCRYVDQFI
jgi:hypothetical protein